MYLVAYIIINNLTFLCYYAIIQSIIQCYQFLTNKTTKLFYIHSYMKFTTMITFKLELVLDRKNAKSFLLGKRIIYHIQNDILCVMMMRVLK